MQLEMCAVDDLVREIARALVDDSDSVEVETVDREENTVLKLRVAPQDVGKASPLHLGHCGRGRSLNGIHPIRSQPEYSMTAPDQWVWVAHIRRPQGRKGEVFADILTDFPERFAERKRLWLLTENANATGAPAAAKAATLGPREVELSSHWPHKGGIVLHFSGFDSITAAETLAGLIVAIPSAERTPLGEDEVYIGDLVGCALFDVSHESEPGGLRMLVGEIEDVDRTAGPVALLVVRGVAGEVLVPFAKSFLRKLDLAGKRVEMALPEGLVDLNAPAGK
jgi:16S rRNA processing protein RimM